MPYYDYECGACGPFTEMRPMAECTQASPCPACGGESPRVILSAPGFALMDSATRTAHATNEKARHEPKSSRSLAHGPGCSCCSGKKSSRTLHRPDGSKSFPANRPWQINH